MTDTTPGTAVCDACGWEGTEDDVVSPGDGVVADACPRCKQSAVNYFWAASVEDK